MERMQTFCVSPGWEVDPRTALSMGWLVVAEEQTECGHGCPPALPLSRHSGLSFSDTEREARCLLGGVDRELGPGTGDGGTRPPSSWASLGPLGSPSQGMEGTDGPQRYCLQPGC